MVVDDHPPRNFAAPQAELREERRQELRRRSRAHAPCSFACGRPPPAQHARVSGSESALAAARRPPRGRPRRSAACRRRGRARAIHRERERPPHALRVGRGRRRRKIRVESPGSARAPRSPRGRWQRTHERERDREQQATDDCPGGKASEASSRSGARGESRDLRHEERVAEPRSRISALVLGGHRQRRSSASARSLTPVARSHGLASSARRRTSPRPGSRGPRRRATRAARGCRARGRRTRDAVPTIARLGNARVERVDSPTSSGASARRARRRRPWATLLRREHLRRVRDGRPRSRASRARSRPPGRAPDEARRGPKSTMRTSPRWRRATKAARSRCEVEVHGRRARHVRDRVDDLVQHARGRRVGRLASARRARTQSSPPVAISITRNAPGSRAAAAAALEPPRRPAGARGGRADEDVDDARDVAVLADDAQDLILVEHAPLGLGRGRERPTPGSASPRRSRRSRGARPGTPCRTSRRRAGDRLDERVHVVEVARALDAPRGRAARTRAARPRPPSASSPPPRAERAQQRGRRARRAARAAASRDSMIRYRRPRVVRTLGSS